MSDAVGHSDSPVCGKELLSTLKSEPSETWGMGNEVTLFSPFKLKFKSVSKSFSLISQFPNVLNITLQVWLLPQTSKSAVKGRVTTSFTLKCSPHHLLLVNSSLFVVGKITDVYCLRLFVLINHHLYWGQFWRMRFHCPSGGLYWESIFPISPMICVVSD